MSSCGEHAHILIGAEAELLVHLIATHARQVVALRVEQQPLEVRTRGLDGGRLARAQALVGLDEGVLAGESGVALDGAKHHIGIAEELRDLVVRNGNAQRTQKHRRGLLALAVDGHHELAALIDLELEPCAARRNDLRLEHAVLAVPSPWSSTHPASGRAGRRRCARYR